MEHDLLAAKRRRYLSEIIDLFPDGEPRLDLLCEATAQLLDCQHASINLITDKKLFAIGAYNVPVRELELVRKRPFDDYGLTEFRCVTDEHRKAMYLDRQGFDLGYAVRVPFMVDGVSLGGFFVGGAEPRVDGLSTEQMAGLKAASELAAQTLKRSERIRTQLRGLIGLLVT